MRATLLPPQDPAAQAGALADEWRALEARADRPFFLSWTWIGVWLGTPGVRPWLLRVEHEGRVVGLGLLCPHIVRRRKIMRVRTLRLHETGDPEIDVLTIEYNGLLAERGLEAPVWQTALSAIEAARAPAWDELVVSGITPATAAPLGAPKLRASTSSAFVDLAALRQRGVGDLEGYVATLGRSTRQQIRRSLKRYAQRGPVTLERAEDAASARAMLDAMRPHHQARWEARGGRGAFGWPAYVDFHDRLIGSWRGVEVLCVRAGDAPIGWLYNFVDRGRVYFYLSGLVFEDDPHLKPGLVTHALAIERHLLDGAMVYDFMGGDNRYKRNLGQPGPDIAAYAVQRPRLMLRAEESLRRVIGG